MNLVEQVRHDLSPGVFGVLSSILGKTEGATRTAAGAAFPAMLSGLAGLASNTTGSQKIIDALGQFDGSSAGEAFQKQPQAAFDRGNLQLDMLFGAGTIQGIVNALARYTGLSSDQAQKLLAYLMPIVLGAVYQRMSGQTMNAQNMTMMLADEKANIANAVPSGFALSEVPGLATAGSGGGMRWMVPVAAVALLAMVAVYAFRPGPTLSVPSVSQASTDLTDSFKAVSGTLKNIDDERSAEKALSKLQDVDKKLEGLRAGIDKMPEAGREEITSIGKANTEKIDAQFAQLAWTPGVGERIRPTMERILGKMASIGGTQVPQFGKVSNDLAGTVSTVRKSLDGIQDAASASAELPKLQELDNRLKEFKAAMDRLPESNKATLSTQVKNAREQLKDLSNKVMSKGGVKEKLEPVMNSILARLQNLSA